MRLFQGCTTDLNPGALLSLKKLELIWEFGARHEIKNKKPKIAKNKLTLTWLVGLEG